MQEKMGRGASVILSVLLLLSSCSPKLMVEQRDSIKTTIDTEWRDSSINVTLPDERVTISHTLRDTVYLSTSVAEVTIYKTDTVYVVTLRNRSEIPLIVPVKFPMQKVTTVRESLIKQTEVKEVHSLYWWQTALIWLGIVAIVALAAKVVWKIYGGRISSVSKASSLVTKLFS